MLVFQDARHDDSTKHTKGALEWRIRRATILRARKDSFSCSSAMQCDAGILMGCAVGDVAMEHCSAPRTSTLGALIPFGQLHGFCMALSQREAGVLGLGQTWAGVK